MEGNIRTEGREGGSCFTDMGRCIVMCTPMPRAEFMKSEIFLLYSVHEPSALLPGCQDPTVHTGTVAF